MGGSQSKVSQENNEEAIMRQIAISEGPSAVATYIENNIDKWKKETVKFGIIGQTASGKSSFVNLVRNVKKGDEGYAKVGRGNTTLVPTPYVHPDNHQIVYWDLPGVATVDFPKDTYVDEMRLQEYDYFFVFFDPVLQEDDVWVAEQLISMRKPFCLVRSKVDIDIEEEIKHGIDEKTVLLNLRTKMLRSVNKNVNLTAHCKLFFISCEKRGVGEIDILFQHIRENLSSIKFEAVVYSLHTSSEEVIREKYNSLKSRVFKASVGAAIFAALPIPALDVCANIGILVSEIKHYIKVFGLTRTNIRKLNYRDQKKLRCKELYGLGSGKIFEVVKKLFIQRYLFLITTLAISDIILPIFGSAVSGASTATIVYKFLNEILENLHHDAIFLYNIILPLPVRTIRKLREIFENEGQEGIDRYIFDVLNGWKEETVLLGVIGKHNSGKNEFINLMRHLKIGTSGFAKENKNTRPYYHPNNEGIVFVETDLSNSKDMHISCYDDFFVFLNGEIYTDDISILHELTKIDKSFSVIRTKSATRTQNQEAILGKELLVKRDQEDDSVRPELLVKRDDEINSVRQELLVKRDEKIDSVRLREIICSHMYKECEYEYDMHVCVLSCLSLRIGELDELINRLIQRLPQAKSEAVLNALHPLSKLVIEEKFQTLRKRIVCVTTAATLTTTFQIPSICLPVKMHILVDEITHYIKVFGFSDKIEESNEITDTAVSKLLCRELLEPGAVFSDIIHRQLQTLSTVENITPMGKIAELFVPVAGSVVSTANNAAIVFKCLTSYLEDFRHDAFVVHDRVLADYK